jgi:glycosyltransferase involved in cell wall biosynthesis
VRLDQVVAAAAPADAVTTQALAWQRVLRRHGVGGDVYAEHVHPELAREVRPLREFDAATTDACLLRYSIWSHAVERAREVPPDRLGILYHNITPGHLLAGEQPAVAELCDRGRRALPSFAGRVRVAIADSGYNASELEAAGIGPVAVVPLLLGISRPPARTVHDRVEPRVLSVGRVVPSKRLEEAIRAVALLRARRPEVTLDLIGAWDGFDRYRDALGRFARDLGVGDAVRFRGRVGDAERDEAYARAGVYICTSAHEGFCAPLVEAMAQGLPVVAHDAGAVAETLGGAGLVIPDADAALTAEALQAVLEDARVRAALAARASRRLAELEPSAVEPRILAALEPLIGAVA